MTRSAGLPSMFLIYVIMGCPLDIWNPSMMAPGEYLIATNFKL
jgi:hypothetical protein